MHLSDCFAKHFKIGHNDEGGGWVIEKRIETK